MPQPLLQNNDSDQGCSRFYCFYKTIAAAEIFLKSAGETISQLKHEMNNELQHKQHTGTVALGGGTAGGVRVRLDLFCYFFVSRQKSRIQFLKTHLIIMMLSN